MAPKLTRYDGPEVRLLWDATGVDVTGWRAGDLDADLIDEVLKEHPRVGFAAEFGAAFADQAVRKPASRGAQMARDEGMLDRIASCALDRPPWVATPRVQ